MTPVEHHGSATSLHECKPYKKYSRPEARPLKNSIPEASQECSDRDILLFCSFCCRRRVNLYTPKKPHALHFLVVAILYQLSTENPGQSVQGCTGGYTRVLFMSHFFETVRIGKVGCRNHVRTGKQKECSVLCSYSVLMYVFVDDEMYDLSI